MRARDLEAAVSVHALVFMANELTEGKPSKQEETPKALRWLREARSAANLGKELAEV
jgi:hypothetical protein